VFRSRIGRKKKSHELILSDDTKRPRDIACAPVTGV
jgi:hypothetical protein